MNHVAVVALPSLREGAEASQSLRVGKERVPLWQYFRPGQLLELSGQGPGKLSTAARLIVRAQAEREPVAWVAERDAASFYPPDMARAGVDLTRLVVVRVPPEQGSHALVRACEVLLRSGAFGLVVIDFGASARGDARASAMSATVASALRPRAPGRAVADVAPGRSVADVGGGSGRAVMPRGELAWLSRLSGLARMHQARVALLTYSMREQPSLGPLIGLRIEPRLQPEGDARVVLAAELLKSKLGAQAALSPDVRSLPAGARL